LALTAYLGYDPNTGEQNRPRKTVKAENKKQAERMLREWITELEKGIVPSDSKMTVQVFSEEWLKKHCEANLAPKTVHTYREKLNGHILPVRFCSTCYPIGFPASCKRIICHI
jgi:hypothetical protein